MFRLIRAFASIESQSSRESVIKFAEIARGQESRMLELRASTDLARLRRNIGSPNDPRALLEPILATIEGGEGLRDVRAARAVLAEIA